MFDQAEILNYLSQYAYQPWVVYGLVTALLTASSFGLPIPEEVTLISCGLVGYMALHPEQFPPPSVNSTPVNPITLSIVCFLAVFLSDLIVFFIGRYGGMKLLKARRLQKYVTSEAFQKTIRWVESYGAIMAGAFRFTPGLRFPGHMACGMLGLKTWKFCAVDGLAALLTVPTQVLFVAYYGDVILSYFKQFKIAVFIILILAVTLFLTRRFWIQFFNYEARLSKK